jgi:serine/tyrosine/threonine adenylyltransferase
MVVQPHRAQNRDNTGVNQATPHNLLAPSSKASSLDFRAAGQARFANLGAAFYTRLSSQALPAPYLVASSRAMARELGLDDEWLSTREAVEAFTGNTELVGSEPFASVYSGHQFGVWAGQLGDGRAISLGETQNGWEIQLKGSGRTPYSRMGDGRAVLRSSIREFLCSEAMHALGIPTTRALCVTGSNAPVYREEVETSAVVARCAPSFIRFGHFEHFSYNGQHNELKALADYVIERYYPACKDSPKPYAALLEAVSAKTAALLSQWQAVGFCHGVMNTDNMSILGLTIDYGPFQFLDAFDPGHICNHSDTQGRYAYARQPNIAYWNLFCLGQALLPLMDSQEDALAALEPYKTLYPQALQAQMRAKLGLRQAVEGDLEHIERLMKLLAADKVDWTIFWRRLSHATRAKHHSAVRDMFLQREEWDTWLLSFSELSAHNSCGPDADLMLKTNPCYVLRNHLGEQAIRAAKLKDFSEVTKLHNLLQSPFDEQAGMDSYADFPPAWASGIEISCSS